MTDHEARAREMAREKLLELRREGNHAHCILWNEHDDKKRNDGRCPRCVGIDQVLSDSAALLTERDAARREAYREAATLLTDSADEIREFGKNALLRVVDMLNRRATTAQGIAQERERWTTLEALAADVCNAQQAMSLPGATVHVAKWRESAIDKLRDALGTPQTDPQRQRRRES